MTGNELFKKKYTQSQFWFLIFTYLVKRTGLHFFGKIKNIKRA